jgi:hypothetical protein
MSLYSPYGVPAASAPLETLSRCIFHLSAPDLEWSPTTGALIALSGHTGVLTRAATATALTDSLGVTYTAVNNQIPLEARDWNNNGQRDGFGIRFGTSDRLPFTAGFMPMAMAFYAEIIETAAAGFRFSLSNAANSGAGVYLDAVASAYRLNHHNGSVLVSSLLGSNTAIGDRVVLFGYLGATGTIKLYMRVNGGSLVTATTSAANSLAASWAAGFSLYLGSLGSGTGGQGWLRKFKLVVGAPTEALLSTLY